MTSNRQLLTGTAWAVLILLIVLGAIALALAEGSTAASPSIEANLAPSAALASPGDPPITHLLPGKVFINLPFPVINNGLLRQRCEQNASPYSVCCLSSPSLAAFRL